MNMKVANLTGNALTDAQIAQIKAIYKNVTLIQAKNAQQLAKNCRNLIKKGEIAILGGCENEFKNEFGFAPEIVQI
jgi:hypothetical protein